MQTRTQLANELWPLILPRVRSIVDAAGKAGGASSGAAAAVGEHDLGGSLHRGVLRNEQGPQFLLTNGSRSLVGNLAVDAGVTIDGVDLDVHAANPDAHHARQHGILSANDHTVTGSAYQIIGLTGANTLGLLTPSSNVNTGAAEAVLKSNSSGVLGIKGLTVGSAMTLSGSGDITAYPDIQFTGSGFLAAESDVYIALDSDNNATNRALIVGRDSSTTTGFSEVFRLSEQGLLRITATTPTISTAANDLTIAPAGDLLLSPGGLDAIITQASALRSDNYLKTILIAGFRIGPTSISGQTGIEAGSAEFDELRARTFVADETRVDRGQEYVTKSYGVLSRAFTVPASVGGTANLYVENSPHIVGAVFTANDWVLLRYLDMSSGIVLTSVWGQVTSYYVTGLTGEQRWTFTLRQGTGGLEFAKGALVTDFGQSGQGYILTDAVTATSPFVQVGRWSGSDPYTPANYSVLTQIGRLDGVGFTGEYGLAAAVTGFADTDAFVKITTSAAQMNNVPIRMYNSGTNTGAWYANGQFDIGFDGVSVVADRDFTIHASGYVRIGRGTTNYPNVFYSKTDGYIAVRSGTTDKIRLDSNGSSYFAGVMTIGTSGEIRQGTGTLGADYTGLRIWRDSNVGRIGGYKSNTLQWYADTGGELRAGGGLVSVAADGFGMARYETTVGVPIAGTESRAALAWWDDISSRTGAPLARIYAARSDAGTGAYPSLSIEVDPANADTDLRPSIWLVANWAGFAPTLWLNNIYGVVGLPGIYPSRNATTLADTVQFSGSLYFEAHLLRDPANTALDIGTAGNPFRTLYATNVVAASISGAAMSGQEWEYAGSMQIDAASASNTTLTVTNSGAGSADLAVDRNITLGGTVDGVDLAAFYAAYGSHNHDAAYAPLTRNLTAGNGLTGGGTLAADRTFAVGAGDGISVAADAVAVDATVARSTWAVNAGNGLTGGGNLAAAGITLALASSAAGAGLAFATGVLSVTPGEGLEIETDAIGLASSVAGNGLTYATGVLAVGVSGLGLSVGADAVTLTSSSNPGAAASILATTAAGALTLAQLTVSSYLYMDGTVDFGTNTLYEDATYLQVAGAKPLSVGGAVFISPSTTITTVPNIQFASNAIISSVGHLYISLDSNSAFTNRAFVIGHDSAGTTGFASLFTFDEAGLATITGKVRVPVIDTASGTLTISPATDLLLSPGSNLVKLLDGKAVQTQSFVSGFAGSGFRIDQGVTTAARTHIEVDDLTVRGRMSVYELLIRQVRATNGSVFVTSTGKAKRVGTVTGGYRIYTTTAEETPTATTDHAHGFLVGDLIRAQRTRWNGSTLESIYQCDLRVTTVDDLYTFRAVLVSGDIPTAGMEFVRLGSTTDANRRGSVYLTADDTNAPFVDVVDGVALHSEWNTSGKVKVRLGKLTGITSTANEYGLMAGNGFANADQWIKAASTGVELHNAPLQFYNGSTETIHFGAWNDVWFGPSSADKRLTWNGTTLAITGTVTATAGYIGTAAAGWAISSSQISNDYVRIYSGGPSATTSRIEVGDYGSASTGLVGVVGIRGADGASSSIGMWAGRNYANRASAPFRMTLGGDLYAASADITGAIKATSGYIGGSVDGWAIGSGSLSSTGVRLYSGAALVARLEFGDGVTDAKTAGIKSGDDGTGGPFLWAGKLLGDRFYAPFRVYANGDTYISNLTATGAITATSGAVGGWTVAASSITSTNIGLYSGAAGTARLEVGSGSNMAGVVSGTAAGDVVMWAGSTYANTGAAAFRVTLGGSVYATGGGTLGDITLASGNTYIDAPTSYGLATKGYKFRYGTSIAAGLTTYYVSDSGASYMYLDNNTDAEASAAKLAISAATNIRTMASGAGKTSQVALIAFHATTGASVASVNLANDGSARTVNLVGTAVTINSNTAWHAGNDGTGSTLDADLLDGQHGSAFARLDGTGATFTGAVTFSNAVNANGTIVITQQSGDPSYVNGKAIMYLKRNSASSVTLRVRLASEDGLTTEDYAVVSS